MDAGGVDQVLKRYRVVPIMDRCCDLGVARGSNLPTSTLTNPLLSKALGYRQKTVVPQMSRSPLAVPSFSNIGAAPNHDKLSPNVPPINNSTAPIPSKDVLPLLFFGLTRKFDSICKAKGGTEVIVEAIYFGKHPLPSLSAESYGGSLTYTSSSDGNVLPLSLNALPNELSAGKVAQWQGLTSGLILPCKDRDGVGAPRQ